MHCFSRKEDYYDLHLCFVWSVSFLKGTASTITLYFIKKILLWHCTYKIYHVVNLPIITLYFIKISYFGIVLTKIPDYIILYPCFNCRLCMNVYEKRCVGRWMLKLQKMEAKHQKMREEKFYVMTLSFLDGLVNFNICCFWTIW